MNEYLIRYAFTDEELQKYSGLFSWLAKTTLGKLIKLIVNGIKKLVLWAMATYGITTISDIYTKAKENPMEVLQKHEWRAWRSEEGFFENIFRIGSYLLATFGLSGVVILVIDKFLSKNFNISFEDFGKWLDKKLNTTTDGNLNVDPSSLNLEGAVKDLFITNSFTVSISDLKIIHGIEEKYDGKIIQR